MRFRKDEKVELISKVPLLARCSKKELGLVATLADLVQFHEGDTLMQEGQVGREFFIIVAGSVRVTRRGRKLADMGPGDWVGEIALISNVPRTATVVATSPLHALVLTRPALSGLMYEVPSIAENVMASLGERLVSHTI
ncbi:MAG TPA: cyclic nucleotide-binding domain-containing protein [Gaiellaceae bacterium]|nr:cyclic nucleotide-binding domain-containing protein [Gaiellaceae bacterium]